MNKTEIIKLIKSLNNMVGDDQAETKADFDGEVVASHVKHISRLQYLKDAFLEIKKRQEEFNQHESMPTMVNGVSVNSVKLSVDRHKVDNFIEKELKGRRVGLCISWSLEDAIYKYEPLEERLTRSSYED